MQWTKHNVRLKALYPLHAKCHDVLENFMYTRVVGKYIIVDMCFNIYVIKTPNINENFLLIFASQNCMYYWCCIISC